MLKLGECRLGGRRIAQNALDTDKTNLDFLSLNPRAQAEYHKQTGYGYCLFEYRSQFILRNANDYYATGISKAGAKLKLKPLNSIE